MKKIIFLFLLFVSLFSLGQEDDDEEFMGESTTHAMRKSVSPCFNGVLDMGSMYFISYGGHYEAELGVVADVSFELFKEHHYHPKVSRFSQKSALVQFLEPLF